MEIRAKYNFPEEYFQDEERAGFLITECMKRYWAASLHSLEIFDGICRKHGLKYWADCGTMLGAVRHGGFIPWDDDIDIGMMREDFNRFLEIAPGELPARYSVEFKDDPPRHNYNGIAVVNSLRAVSFEEEVLQEYFFCPFPVGFDVYPYDHVPEDRNARDIWRGKYLKLLLAINLFRERKPGDKEASDALKAVGIDPSKAWNEPDAVRDRLTRMAEKIAGSNLPGSGPYVNRFFFLAVNNAYLQLPGEWFSDLIEVPFETGSIPVCRNIYDYAERMFGGGWRVPVLNASSHNYPLYRNQLEYMIDFLQKGRMRLSDLPPQLRYLKREADIRGIEYI